MPLLQTLQRLRDKLEAKLEERQAPPQQAQETAPYPAPLPEAQTEGRVFVNAVYYPSWAAYDGKTPRGLDVANITHVFYAFMGLDQFGQIKHQDEWMDLHKGIDGRLGCMPALAHLKRENPHIKTILSVGGGKGSAYFSAMANSDRGRHSFALQLRKFCNKHGFDGIDIDWEHPKDAKDGYNYLKTMMACRVAFPPEDGLILTTALPCSQHVLKHIDLAALSNTVDFLNLMAYDFTGSWTDVCGHHAQLWRPEPKPAEACLGHCSSDAVDYVLAMGFAPSTKILLGIPAYARCFPKALKFGAPNQKRATEINYVDIPDQWVDEAIIDDKTAAASHVDEERNGFMSFDVPRTVAIKAHYVVAKDLGGLFFWTGSGDKPGHRSLVAAGKRGLVPSPPSYSSLP